MTFRFDPEEYCRQATERRKRLMNPPTSNKPSPAPTAQRTVNIAHGIPAWRRGCGITFDAHVSDYLKSSRFAQGPNVYIRRRAAEMGFAAGDVLDFIRFRPLVAVRALLIWELIERFGLPVCAIAEMLEMDLTAAHRAKNSPRPDPVKVCVCSITKVGQTYFEAMRELYESEVNLQQTADRFGVSYTSIHRVAHRMGWTLRKANNGGRKPL